MQPWTERNSRYVSYTTPWRNFYLLHAAHARPDFITDDIIKKTKSLVIQKGHYQDPSSALKEVVSTVTASVNEDELEAIASLMHKNGTRWSKARLADDSPSRLQPADLQDDTVMIKRRVRDELVKRGVLQHQAQDVADVWCSKVCAYHFTDHSLMTCISFKLWSCKAASWDIGRLLCALGCTTGKKMLQRRRMYWIL
jgi:hypothetical protein